MKKIALDDVKEEVSLELLIEKESILIPSGATAVVEHGSLKYYLQLKKILVERNNKRILSINNKVTILQASYEDYTLIGLRNVDITHYFFFRDCDLMGEMIDSNSKVKGLVKINFESHKYENIGVLVEGDKFSYVLISETKEREEGLEIYFL